MNQHEKINYVEFPAANLQANKDFYTNVFGWTFQDYGADYSAFSNAGLEGGFFKSELKANTTQGSALIVLYSDHLEETLAKVLDAGGILVKDIFSFPGGRRFHFADPSGNELAVWSDKET